MNSYSYCPTCRTQATGRTRGIPTYDLCAYGHRWLASDGLKAEQISEFDVAQAEQKRKDDLLTDAIEALDCQNDVETLRLVAHLGDDFHKILEKWRTRIQSLLADSYPIEEQHPGWEAHALREMARLLRQNVLSKSNGDKG